MPATNFSAPFKSRDFTLLYLTNLFEFFASTLSKLSALQWLYESAADGKAGGRALGALGAVTLVSQIPSIALGGVLADTFTRTKLVARVQTVACAVAILRWMFCATGALQPIWIYLSVGMLEITSRLESSARSSIIASVVEKDALPNAVTIVQITQYSGEVLAPFLFWLLADAGGGANNGVSFSDGDSNTTATVTNGDNGKGLSLAFFAAALSFVPCTILPRLIKADTTPKTDAADADTVATTKPSSGGVAAIRKAWLGGLKKMVEGLRYIMGHPLLPGLYALDWGFTCVSFYRELFPLWVGVWLIYGVPQGMSTRGAVALLVVSNFTGGIAGSFGTFKLNSYPYKGRLVVCATCFYGFACFLFGCVQNLFVGALFIFLMGAGDAVGATMRKQVVLLSTPDHLRGRAQSGHQMAAYVANSIGQLYVGFMVSAIGAGATMKIGGVVTEMMTGISAWRIPALLTYKGDTESNSATAALPTVQEEPKDDGWEMNDAAKAAMELEEAQRREEAEERPPTPPPPPPPPPLPPPEDAAANAPPPPPGNAPPPPPPEGFEGVYPKPGKAQPKGRASKAREAAARLGLTPRGARI